MVSQQHEVHSITKPPPPVWADFCKKSFEVTLAVFTLFVLWLHLLSSFASGDRDVSESESLFSPPAVSTGQILGVLGTVGVSSVECIALCIQEGRRSQTRRYMLVLGASISLIFCTAALPDTQVRQFGLLGLSMVTKFTVPLFGWDERMTLGYLCCSTLAASCMSWFFIPADGTLGNVELVLSDCFFSLAAGMIWLVHNCALKEMLETVRVLELDNTALRQVMRLSCDSELCVSISSDGEGWIDTANPQLVDLIGRDVEGECLSVIMQNEHEYKRAVSGLKELTADQGPMLRHTTLKNRRGEALFVEMFAVQLEATGYEDAQGCLRSKGSRSGAIYLVGIRQDPSDADAFSRLATPASCCPSSRQSPAESIGSVMPHLIGRPEDHDINPPSPAISWRISNSKSSGKISVSSCDVFQKGKMDMSQLMQLGVKEHWLIDVTELELHPYSVLGRGGFGIVLEAAYYGIQLAAKINKMTPHKCASLDDVQKAQSLVEELRMLRHARHPNIVQFYGACIEEKTREIVLVFEKIDAPTLGKFLAELLMSVEIKETRSHQYRLKIMLDLARALDYLHARKPSMIHGDLKPANVFVHWKGPTAVLSDFGLARTCADKDSNKVGGFTTRWAAPEIVLGQSRPTTAADVFSFGRLMSFIITDKLPLHRLDEDGIAKLMRRRKPLPMPDWPQNHLADISAHLAGACLSRVPESRPQMAKIRGLLEQAPLLLASGPSNAASSSPMNLLALIPDPGAPGAGNLRPDDSHAGATNSRDAFIRSLQLARERPENGPSHLR
eukprot:TRINITY_DN12986_c0_g1_i1.p1 TRINITY_DN12986_c0_g1~~TRINITY_DN12986_c0_g1_i1.p1  ORF type:complete len:793 (+),score=107.37 TRINITY_DN12986_c0_g1_i1:26-2380(+)